MGMVCGSLVALVITLGAAVVIRDAPAQQDAEGPGPLLDALAFFVPAVSALVYGLFAPDIPKLRGGI